MSEFSAPTEFNFVLDGMDVIFDPGVNPSVDREDENSEETLFFIDPEQAELLGLPDVFCVGCGYLGAFLPNFSDYLFDNEGTSYYLGGLLDVNNIAACIECDPMLAGDSRFTFSGYQSAMPQIEVVDLLNAVDEPPTLSLALLGLPLFRLRRAR